MTESIDEACRFEARCTNASASPIDESPASLNDMHGLALSTMDALDEKFAIHDAAREGRSTSRTSTTMFISPD